jgi:hypothetical protein
LAEGLGSFRGSGLVAQKEVMLARSKRPNPKLLASMAAQGDRLGSLELPEVRRYPVLGCIGGISNRQLETACYHLDRMAEDERERAVEALMCFDGPVTTTIAGMPLMPEDEPPDAEQFPYLAQHAFRRGTPRYRKD